MADQREEEAIDWRVVARAMEARWHAAESRYHDAEARLCAAYAYQEQLAAENAALRELTSDGSVVIPMRGAQ